MQTILAVQCASPGAIYLNGRFAGETDAVHPLTLPVSPFGALILEYKPFSAGLMPLALRIPFSKGVPLVPEPDARMYAAVWPDGFVEIELLPEKNAPAPLPIPLAQTGDVRFSFENTSPPAVRCESSGMACRHLLPEGALPPAVTPIPSGFLLTGSFPECEPDRQYALVLPPDASTVLLSITGQSPALLDGGAALRLLHPYGDSVGHAALETWSASPDGWQLTASEPMWADGTPHRPGTPEETAVAAVQAAQMGLMSEAAACFSPVFPCTETLAHAAEYDGCVKLRRPLMSGEAAIGLTRLKENVLHVTPARFAAVPGGPNSPWLLTGLFFGEV